MPGVQGMLGAFLGVCTVTSVGSWCITAVTVAYDLILTINQIHHLDAVHGGTDCDADP